MKRWMLRVSVVLCALVGAGCTSGIEQSGSLEGRWGPGVSNPDLLKSKLRRLMKDDRIDELRTVYMVMTWTQACYVYRTSPDLREILKLDLIEGERSRFGDMTRQDTIALLGKPDDTPAGEHGTSLIYTGMGSASDSTSGYIFEYDAHGKLVGITSAN